MAKAPKRVNTRKASAPKTRTPRPRWTEDQPASETPARAHAGATETPAPAEAPTDPSEPPKGTRKAYWEAQQASEKPPTSGED